MKRNILLTFLTILVLLNSTAIGYYIYHDQKEQEENEEPPFFLMKSSDVDFPPTFSLAGEPVPLERIDVAEAFQKELIVNTYLHSHTIQALRNAPRYFHIIEPILKAEGVPNDFKYLAVIESNLNPLAVSYAGAVGIWQLMGATAKELGLERRGRTLPRGKSDPCSLLLPKKSLSEIRFVDFSRGLLQWRYEYARQTNESTKREKLLRSFAKRGNRKIRVSNAGSKTNHGRASFISRGTDDSGQNN